MLSYKYPMIAGIIKEIVDVRRSEVLFHETKSTDIVPIRFIIPLVGAVSRPQLMVRFQCKDLLFDVCVGK